MTTQISKLKRERAKNDPESEFKSPAALANEVGLTRGEKIAALDRWAFIVDRRLSSGDESMPTYGTESRDAELMREIELEKEKLEHKH